MTAAQIKELIEITKAVSYLDGFIEGHGVNAELSDSEDYPLDTKNINEVYDLSTLLKKQHNNLVLKFNNGNTNANK